MVEEKNTWLDGKLGHLEPVYRRPDSYLMMMIMMMMMVVVMMIMMMVVVTMIMMKIARKDDFSTSNFINFILSELF